MKPCADFTFDSAADCFVVMMDDGTEICRTRGLHTAASRMVAQQIVHMLNNQTMVLTKDGLHMGYWEQLHCKNMVDFCFPVTYHQTPI